MSFIALDFVTVGARGVYSAAPIPDPGYDERRRNTR